MRRHLHGGLTVSLAFLTVIARAQKKKWRILVSRKSCLATALILLMVILSATSFENISSDWSGLEGGSNKVDGQSGIVHARMQETSPLSPQVKFIETGVNISISVSPKRIDSVMGVVQLYQNVTCAWWIEGFPISDYIMNSFNYYVNFTVTSPSGEKVKEVVYNWPEGIGNYTDPIVQVYSVPSDAESGLYECKVELHSSAPPYYEEADNSDVFGVRVTPPDFNFALILTPLDPFGGVDATSLCNGQYDEIVQDVLKVTAALTRGTPDSVTLTSRLLTPQPDIFVELTTYIGTPTFDSAVRVTVSGHPLGSYILEVAAAMNFEAPFEAPSSGVGKKRIVTYVLCRRLYVMQIYSAPVILDFSPKSGGAGTWVTISGWGLNGTDVYLGDTHILFGAHAEKSAQGEEVSFRVHESMPTGSYLIRVESPYGSTTHQSEFVILAPNEIAITGLILYQDDWDGWFKPARRCKITIRKGDHIVAEAVTRENGYFIAVANRLSVIGDRVKVRINGLTTSDFDRGMNYATKVAKDLDFCNEYVWFDSVERVIPQDGPLDFGVLNVFSVEDHEFTGYWIENSEGICGGDAQHLTGGSVYLNIADAVLAAYQYADGMRSDDDSIGKVAVEYPDNNFQDHYNPYFNHICLRSEHGYNDGVIIHEYGHHLEFQISRITLPPPWEWAHAWDSDKYPEFAWFEGFPAYLGNIVVARKNYAGGYSDCLYRPHSGMEHLSGSCMPFSVSKESTVAALLWDLVDNHTDPVFSGISLDEHLFDNVTDMDRVIFQIFDSDFHTMLMFGPEFGYAAVQPTLNHFADFLRLRAPSQEVETLLSYYGV